MAERQHPKYFAKQDGEWTPFLNDDELISAPGVEEPIYMVGELVHMQVQTKVVPHNRYAQSIRAKEYFKKQKANKQEAEKVVDAE